MSIHKVTYVRCDGCGCNDSADMADEGVTATEQRRELKDMAWSTGTTWGDLCPDCRADRIAQTVQESRAAQGLPPYVDWDRP